MGKVNQGLRVNVPSLDDMLEKAWLVGFVSSDSLDRLSIFDTISLTEDEVLLFFRGQPTVLVLGQTDEEKGTQESATNGDDAFDEKDPAPTFDPVSPVEFGETKREDTGKGTSEGSRSEKEGDTTGQFCDGQASGWIVDVASTRDI